jgi:hypothetical protein
VQVADSDGANSNTSTVTVAIANVAPTVTLSGPTSANEGQTKHYTFTTSDPGQDTFSLVGQSCGASGTLSNPLFTTATGAGSFDCTFPDGPASSIASVQVADSDGANSNASTVTVAIANVNPTAEAGGPYTCTAGTSTILSGSATDPSTADTAAGFTYAWLVNGTLAYSGATPTLSNCGGLGAGTYPVLLTVTDKDGGVGTDTSTLTVLNATHSITLVPGWNLISFNLHPVSTAITDVLASVSGNYDLVYAWDAQAQAWLKYDNIPQSSDSLNTLDEKVGFWIHMTATGTLNVVGSIPTTTNISLSANGGGWNLVGYPSAVNRNLPGALSGINFSLVYAYHANDLSDPWKLYDTNPAASGYNDLTALSPGWGYWVKVGTNGTWTVSYP